MAKRVAVASVVLASLGVTGWLLGVRGGRLRTDAASTAPAASRPELPASPPSRGLAERPVPAVAAPRTAPFRYLAIGGGADPESTEVSLEHDLKLAVRVLRGPGALLFGGGDLGRPVRVLDPALSEPGLLARLGDLFQPRLGRGSSYRQSALESGGATLKQVEAALTGALATGAEPLLLYVAAHGEQGERAADNYAVLWGGEGLTVRRLAELHAGHPRPLRVVAASCFSGGFAELAFEGADADRGPVQVPRCGLFAGTWDRQTSGCDPDPDRRAHEGYSLHFLAALEGHDREGRALPEDALDLDGDGRVSLLEAHTRATIASRSIDVPTTTSQRLLRWFDAGHAVPRPGLLPEEARVVEVLGVELGLPDVAAADARWRELDAELASLDAALTEADAALADASAALAMRLLARWPLLDDPYHPRFAALLQAEAPAITAVLDASDEGRAFAGARARVHALETELWDREITEARVLRLVRAHDTLGRASALRARGGDAWARYEALLACERWAPPGP